MAIFRRALSDRPDDLEECLFFVKAKQDKQIQGTGIACAVEMVVRGEKKCFLLTSTDVKNKPSGRVFAHRCYRSWFRPKQNSVEVGHCYEDPKFSFILLDCISKKSLKLVNPENIGKKSICRSFVITQRSFKTIYWRYCTEEQKYRLQEDTELEESAALGSPVLWTDDDNRSFVVGVVGRTGGVFFPEMFTPSALKLTENLPVPIQVNQVQGIPNPSVPKPNLSDENPTKPNPTDQNNAYPSPPNQNPTVPNPPNPKPNPTDPNPPYAIPNPTDPNPPNPSPSLTDLNPSTPKSHSSDPKLPSPYPRPTDPNPRNLSPNPTDTNPPNPKPPLTDPNPSNLNPNPTDLNPSNSNPNPSDPNPPNPKPHPSDPKPRNISPNPTDTNPPNTTSDPTYPNPPNHNPNLADPNPINPTPNQPPNRTGNFTSKLSSSVGVLIFLFVIILGILLEMWIPWLTGRLVKPNSYLRKS